MSAQGMNPHTPDWLDRVVEEAMRDGRIAFSAGSHWRERLVKEPEVAEAEIFSLAASPTVGEDNVRRLEAR